MIFSALIPPNRCGLRVAALSNLSLLAELGHPHVIGGDMLPLIFEQRMPSPDDQEWRDGRKCIGYWVCESSVASSKYRSAMDAYAQIWTASEASAKALRATGSKTPVYVVPHHVPVPDKEIVRSDRDTVTTLFAFMPPMERKNPEAVIRAWQAAFPKDATTKESRQARLILKVRHAAPALIRLMQILVEADSRIEIIDKDLSDEAMAELYERADIWLSLQRAGAFELHIAQAAAAGLPIITTAVGGPLGYLTDDAAYFIPGREVPPLQECLMNESGVWIEPDQQATVAALRVLAKSAKLRTKMGAAARECVETWLSKDAVKLAMQTALADFELLPQPAAAKRQRAPKYHRLNRLVEPLRTGLDMVGAPALRLESHVPLILSHRRSGTHLLGALIQKHWGGDRWLKSHDWPERRPEGYPTLYVLRNPIDALYSTYLWWRTGGGSNNPEIAAVVDKLTFAQWLKGDAGKIIGYQSWRCGDRDNMEVTRGQMYDPLRYWRDHWRAAHEAGITVLLYEDMVRHPASLMAGLTQLLERPPITPMEVLTERVGLAPSDITQIGESFNQWPANELARLDSLLSPELMQSIGCKSRAEWLQQ
jgi:glycosyltransferase involved in cell wall biosynthesis